MLVSNFSNFLLIILSVASKNVLAQQQSKSCDLECPSFAPCVFGHAYFSERIDVVELGGSHQSGMHCDCPVGWTGIFCDVKFESCSNQARHECYHGGECILGLEDEYGNEQLFCNCDKAEGFVGKYCETPIRDDNDKDPFNREDDDSDNDKDGNNNNNNKNDPISCGDGNCLNGGSCLIEQNILEDGTYQMDESCNCDDAYDEESNSVFGGPFCQYKSTSLCSVGDSLVGKTNYCLHHGVCKEKSQDCECPSGWTGKNCQLKALELDTPIDDDDDETNWASDVCGDTHCYNNGSCVQTEKLESDGSLSLSFSCDCSTASDDKYLYAGKKCEFPSTELCLQGEGSPLFCVNHGSCVDDVLLGCDCPPGFFGFKCELEKRDNFSEGEDDEEEDQEEKKGNGEDWVACGDDIVCHNFAKCITTIAYNQEIDTSETTFNCDCTSTGYFGPQCQYLTTNAEYDDNKEDDKDDEDWEVCGDEIACHNYGKCITTIKTNKETDTSEISFRCDCAETSFMGPQCQYPTTNINDENNYDDEEEDLATSYDGADIVNNEILECRLKCLNGGKCTQGEKDLEFLRDVLGDVNHLNKTHAVDQLAYCECKEGWIGLTCEYRAEICDDKHVCLHGSKCVGNLIDGYSCACEGADGKKDETSAFAGNSCQYSATGTDICTIGDEYPGKPIYFCVNSGICNAWVSSDQPNPGCSCKEGWTGTHCEIRVDGLKTVGEEGSVSVGVILGVSLALLVTLVLVLIGIRIWIIKKEKPGAKDISSSGTSFRRRRRRRAGLGGSNLAPNHQRSSDSPIASTDPPTDNDGIMNHQDREQEVEPYIDEPVFIDSPSSDKNQIQNEGLV